MSNASNKRSSTFTREMKDPKFKKIFDESYKEFLLSELLLTMMENSHKTVRKLAKDANLSPTLIQNLRSNKRKDIRMKNFLRISKVCGYHVILEKGQKRIDLNQFSS